MLRTESESAVKAVKTLNLSEPSLYPLPYFSFSSVGEYMSAGAYGIQKMSGLLELESQVALSHLIQVLNWGPLQKQWALLPIETSLQSF